ncbi:MAG: GspH/FimT family pseudopilin [Desulfobacterium sp.]|nr:GspH/FimT family pseudopilin [Desulfobacterium sp.]
MIQAKRGFSLVDLMIAMMILGIMVLSVPLMFKDLLAEKRLIQASTELVLGLDYARSLAVSRRRPFCVRANIGGNWFRVVDALYATDPFPHHGNDPPLSAFGLVLNPLDKHWYEVDFDRGELHGTVTLTAVPLGNEVCFYPDGHTGSADTAMSLTCAGTTRTITINGMTGQISVQ